jgi:hypothetical protein
MWHAGCWDSQSYRDDQWSNVSHCRSFSNGNRRGAERVGGAHSFRGRFSRAQCFECGERPADGDGRRSLDGFSDPIRYRTSTDHNAERIVECRAQHERRAECQRRTYAW